MNRKGYNEKMAIVRNADVYFAHYEEDRPEAFVCSLAEWTHGDAIVLCEREAFVPFMMNCFQQGYFHDVAEDLHIFGEAGSLGKVFFLTREEYGLLNSVHLIGEPCCVLHLDGTNDDPRIHYDYGDARITVSHPHEEESIREVSGTLPEHAMRRLHHFIGCSYILSAASEILDTDIFDFPKILTTEAREAIRDKVLMRDDIVVTDEFFDAWYAPNAEHFAAEFRIDDVISPSDNVFVNVALEYVGRKRFSNWDIFSIYAGDDENENIQVASAHVIEFTQAYDEMIPKAYELYKDGVLMADIFA